jgi:peptide/nickel transport system permease protein
MLSYILKRVLYMIPTLLIISIISFVIIELPPGDYLTSYIGRLSETGIYVDESAVESLKARYGLGQPIYVRYFKWIKGVVQGDFGQSFEWNMPVGELIMRRVPLTVAVSLFTLIFIYAVAIPIGIYSATHQYSAGDFILTFVGFLGLATPNFMLALVLMFVFYRYFGLSVGGLFSPEYIDAPWSIAKLRDMMNHMWLPVIVIGTSGTCGLIRVMRGTLLDELQKQYVVTGRAKGVKERRLLFKYPVRVAINPVISTIGWLLPAIFSGSTITAIVLSLPITGPLLLRALISQDMYLAGSFLFILASLTVIGTLVSDIMLAWVDPRIRLERRQLS